MKYLVVQWSDQSRQTQDVLVASNLEIAMTFKDVIESKPTELAPFYDRYCLELHSEKESDSVRVYSDEDLESIMTMNEFLDTPAVNIYARVGRKRNIIKNYMTPGGKVYAITDEVWDSCNFLEEMIRDGREVVTISNEGAVLDLSTMDGIDKFKLLRVVEQSLWSTKTSLKDITGLSDDEIDELLRVNVYYYYGKSYNENPKEFQKKFRKNLWFYNDSWWADDSKRKYYIDTDIIDEYKEFNLEKENHRVKRQKMIGTHNSRSARNTSWKNIRKKHQWSEFYEEDPKKVSPKFEDIECDIEWDYEFIEYEEYHLYL